MIVSWADLLVLSRQARPIDRIDLRFEDCRVSDRPSRVRSQGLRQACASACSIQARWVRR